MSVFEAGRGVGRLSVPAPSSREKILSHYFVLLGPSQWTDWMMPPTLVGHSPLRIVLI